MDNKYAVLWEHKNGRSKAHLQSNDGKHTFCGKSSSNFSQDEPATLNEFIHEMTGRCAKCLFNAKIVNAMGLMDND